MTKIFTYSFRALLGSYIRAVVGLVLTAVPVLLSSSISVIVYISVFLFFLFFCYGIRTIIRQMTRFEVKDDGIYMFGPFNRIIHWDELGGFSLHYYSTRRDREDGWMQLKLKGRGSRLKIDSTIGEFDDLLRLTYGAVVRGGLVIDPVSRGNLHVMGIKPPPGGAAFAQGAG
ncbi:hypothetical protein [Sneathiella sp.]|uniref:hypothetical protein n=1 Tax=Sneathiella sp. TaxID=1964365 RepID=UPI0035683268